MVSRPYPQLADCVEKDGAFVNALLGGRVVPPGHGVKGLLDVVLGDQVRNNLQRTHHLCEVLQLHSSASRGAVDKVRKQAMDGAFFVLSRRVGVSE